jgi:hypothetical protein
VSVAERAEVEVEWSGGKELCQRNDIEREEGKQQIDREGQTSPTWMALSKHAAIRKSKP